MLQEVSSPHFDELNEGPKCYAVPEQPHKVKKRTGYTTTGKVDHFQSDDVLIFSKVFAVVEKRGLSKLTRASLPWVDANPLLKV